MKKNSKIYIAGHRGMVGSAILKNLKAKGYSHFITKTSSELDLRNQAEVEKVFAEEKPEYVFLAAAKVGGIIANNTYRADFIYENLQIQNNVIHTAYKTGVKKLLFLGSTCIYPKESPQPMKEEYLLTDTLEYTNEPYAIAKIAGIKMCESYNIQYGTNFFSVMPTNLYGPNDNFDLEKSHVLPALMRKVYLGYCLERKDWSGIRIDFDKNPVEGINGKSEQKEIEAKLEKYGIVADDSGKVKIEIWGSGNPMREFLWSEEMADACVHVMEKVDFSDVVKGEDEIRNTHINIGTGKEVSIKELAGLIKKVVGFNGEFYFNTDKPDGTMRKMTDVSKLHELGWVHKIEIDEGLDRLLRWYLSD